MERKRVITAIKICAIGLITAGVCVGVAFSIKAVVDKKQHSTYIRREI